MKNITSRMISWRHRLFGCAFCLLSLIVGMANGQGVVISVSGPPAAPSAFAAFTGDLGVGSSVLGVSWQTSGSYSNVSISVLLGGNAGATGLAFLTTRIGSGTTTANQVASASFAFPSTTALTPVLSGVSFGAGTYFLIIQQTANGSSGRGLWYGTATPSVTTSANVAANGEYWTTGGSLPAYAPASSFGRGATTYYEYSVTASAVPEPSTIWLVMIGIGVAFFAQIHCCRQSDQPPNQSPEPTAVGAVSSAIAVHVASRRWLSFVR